MAASKRDSEIRRRDPGDAVVCCHGLDWGCAPHRASARRTSLFGHPAFAPVTKKARSVVALSRVLCGEQSAPVSPPAAGQIS